MKTAELSVDALGKGGVEKVQTNGTEKLVSKTLVRTWRISTLNTDWIDAWYLPDEEQQHW